MAKQIHEHNKKKDPILKSQNANLKYIQTKSLNLTIYICAISNLNIVKFAYRLFYEGSMEEPVHQKLRLSTIYSFT